MPELSRFYGIVIKIYFDDHPPPHFHAEYGDHEAVIQIRDLAIIAGALPNRATGMVLEWAALHQRELLSAWQSAVRHEPAGKIEPLA